MKKMKSKCAKCKSDCKKEGTFFTEDGDLFYFCAFCASVLEQVNGGSRIYLFLQDKFPENMTKMPISVVTKSILLSRVNRDKGSTPWSQK